MNDLLQKAIDKYGVVNQLDMCIEECAELIQAINKVKRAKLIHFDNKKRCIEKPNKHMDLKRVVIYNNLCSEVADVKIMISQLELMLSKETIDISFERKLQRLEERINENQN